MPVLEDEICYLGVDVGTGSARAILVTSIGTVLASFSHSISTFRDTTDHTIYEQSTDDIWIAICAAVKSCLKESGVDQSPERVRGVGSDGTCSLAVTDPQGRPLVVTKGEAIGTIGTRNVVLWADHRAVAEAAAINASNARVLEYVGGTMSLEMEIPKILWLKRHMPPSLFAKSQFFDLPDYLTYRATGCIARSACSLTCKCSYIPGHGWDSGFFEIIGLGDIAKAGFVQIGADEEGKLLNAGAPVGSGLSRKAAEELGLVQGTPVGSGLVDAYAGWLGTIAARYKEDGQLSNELPTIQESGHRLAAVAGTSTCHLVQSSESIFVNGIWGPYKNAVFQGWSMNEGGQSSTGQLIEHIVTTHPAYPELLRLSGKDEKDIHTVLEHLLETLRIENNVGTLTELTKDLHVYPDFHGNRSPIADPLMRGSIIGLDLDISIANLARRYYATLEAIALQTRHIIEELNAKGHQITTIYASGGQTKNLPLMQLFADACQMSVVLPGGDSVVLGAAMLARFAAETRKVENKGTAHQAELLWKIMVEMSPVGTLILPAVSVKEKMLLQAKYKIFRESAKIQRRWRKEIDDAIKGV